MSGEGNSEFGVRNAESSAAPSDARAAQQRHSAFRIPKSAFIVAFLAIALGTILYLALVPNNRGQFLHFMPEKIRRWLCEHDDFNNIAAFFVFGLFVFRLPVAPEPPRDSAEAPGAPSSFIPRPSSFRRLFSRLPARMAALMTLVCLLELSQLFIPGRQSEFQDVCTGWSGLFGAWLTAAVLGWHGKGE